MQLIKLILFLFNVIYYIITFPYQLYKMHINSKWRKNIKVGDRAFFINVTRGKTYGKIESILADKKSVGFGSTSRMYTYQIIDIANLKIV